MAFLISNILQDYPVPSVNDSSCGSPEMAHHEHSNAGVPAVTLAGIPAFEGACEWVDEHHEDVEAGDILPHLEELLKNA